MMRLQFWRTDHHTDALDPELLSVFADRAHPPVLEAARLARGRMRVAGALRPEPVTGGWLQRRFAYGVAGGGGLWGAVLGTAAANKAATAVGIGVLLAGGATAEVTGIGPAIREAVSPIYSSGEPNAEATLQAVATSEVAVEQDQPAAANGATITEAPESAPGNLMAQLRPDGSFTLRGVLTDASGDVIKVQTSLDDVPLDFNLGAAKVRLPGSNAQNGPQAGDPATLDDFEGHLVLVTGHCETTEDGLVTEDCDLTTITVLGNGGQDGPPDGVGPPEKAGDKPANGLPEQAQPDDPGPPENANKPSAANQPEGNGRPEDPGKPEGAPGND